MSRIRNAFVTLAALGTVFGAPTAAQAEVYQKYLSRNCNEVFLVGCILGFPSVPAGKTLTITNLSCYLRTSAKASIYGAQLWVSEGTADNVLFAMTPSLQFLNKVASNPANVTIGNVYVSNDTILAVAKAGQFFVAYADARNLTTGEIVNIPQYACHISGQITP